METTFKLDAVTKLKIGNNVVTSDVHIAPDAKLIGMVIQRFPYDGAATEEQLAVFLPHEARAFASAMLAAATSAQT